MVSREQGNIILIKSLSEIPLFPTNLPARLVKFLAVRSQTPTQPLDGSRSKKRCCDATLVHPHLQLSALYPQILYHRGLHTLLLLVFCRSSVRFSHRGRLVGWLLLEHCFLASLGTEGFRVQGLGLEV